MNITVNGKTEHISADSIGAYVDELGLEARTLVVEHNGKVVACEQWTATPLHEGDRLELLSFVGGG